MSQELDSCNSLYAEGNQANEPPNTDVQQENSDVAKGRTSNVNGAYNVGHNKLHASNMRFLKFIFF